MITMFCPSCTCAANDGGRDHEGFFQTKQRLRAQLGDACPRGTGFPCPMRGESAKGFDRETLAALAEEC